MKALLLILAFFAITAIFSLLNSCVLHGRFADYTYEPDGRITITPHWIKPSKPTP